MATTCRRRPRLVGILHGADALALEAGVAENGLVPVVSASCDSAE
jgi:hypothetical protein